jgi:hypothetical protein
MATNAAIQMQLDPKAKFSTCRCQLEHPYLPELPVHHSTLRRAFTYLAIHWHFLGAMFSNCAIRHGQWRQIPSGDRLISSGDRLKMFDICS